METRSDIHPFRSPMGGDPRLVADGSPAAKGTYRAHSPSRLPTRQPAAGRRPAARRRGFTLVELLVVVLIISILVGLLTLGVGAARRFALVTRASGEIDTMAAALAAYHEKYGAYPPDFTDRDAVRRHLARCFPRADAAALVLALEAEFDQGDIGVRADGSLHPSLNPSTALVFWLGGLPDDTGRLSGFSADPRNPFQYAEDSPSRIGPFFDFDPTRLAVTHTDGAYPGYYPDFGAGSERAPYVYFASINSSYGRSTGVLPIAYYNWESPTTGTQERVLPYYHVGHGDWVNPRTFQIISAGADGRFGRLEGRVEAGNAFPTGMEVSDTPTFEYGDGNFDNVTNFSGGTLENAMP